MLITGSIAHSVMRWYLNYLEANFEVFCPTGATRCTDGMKLCMEEGTEGPPKLKILLRFDQNVEYKRPAGAYPLHDFHKICRVCTPFQLKFRWICSRGYGVMGVLS